jgi:Ankyrin repeats (3 copies)
LSELQAILGPLDLHHAENSLLRVSKTIETFLEATRSYITQDDERLGEINAIYHDVSGRLLKISIEQGDPAEAGRLRQILAKHDPEVASQLVDLLSLSDISKRMRSTFDMLELPPMVQRAFDIFTADELCPPLHIALNYRIMLSTNQLQAIPNQSLQATDLLRRNAVHIAAATSQTEFLRGIRLRLTDELLEARDTFGNTPLMVAAYHGDCDSFQILWGTGVGHEIRDLRSRSIMAIACFGGSREIVEFLMLQNISPYDHSVYDGHGALYVAAARNHLELCKILLEYNQTRGEFTQLEKNEAIRVAEESHHTEILRLLHRFTTHAANFFQYLPDSTQPGHSSEIEQGQASSIPEHLGGLQPQCLPWSTVSPTVVPTPGRIWNGRFDNPIQDEWGGHGEFNGNLPGLSDLDGPTFNN